MFLDEPTILFVDDEPMMQALARHWLESAGMRVLIAATGDAALRVMDERRGSLHAVVVDLLMPGMPGDEMVRRLRRTDERLPVIGISGADPEEARARFALGPTDAFVAKPFRSEALLAAIDRARATTHMAALECRTR